MRLEWRDNNRAILQNNIAFMDDCLAKGVISVRRPGSVRKEAGSSTQA